MGQKVSGDFFFPDIKLANQSRNQLEFIPYGLEQAASDVAAEIEKNAEKSQGIDVNKIGTSNTFIQQGLVNPRKVSTVEPTDNGSTDDDGGEDAPFPPSPPPDPDRPSGGTPIGGISISPEPEPVGQGVGGVL